MLRGTSLPLSVCPSNSAEYLLPHVHVCLITRKKESEYTIFGNNEKEDLPLEDNYTRGVGKCTRLEALFSKNSKSNEEIKTE
jgi:DNA repair exonuclease SbcCD nuclease subunit